MQTLSTKRSTVVWKQVIWEGPVVLTEYMAARIRAFPRLPLWQAMSSLVKGIEVGMVGGASLLYFATDSFAAGMHLGFWNLAGIGKDEKIS